MAKGILILGFHQISHLGRLDGSGFEVLEITQKRNLDAPTKFSKCIK